MRVAVLKESFPGEDRVALIPTNVKHLAKLDLEVWVESDAGKAAGFDDASYEEAGAKIVSSRDDLFEAEVLLQVRTYSWNQQTGGDDLAKYRKGQIVIGSCDPLGAADAVKQIADTGATLFALELIPRITRAQSMDVLSSMATIAGYRAVLLASVELPKMFPLLMTAAGTLAAARVFVIGAGVAGLQAIATAKRLGAVVQAYDVRPACREQVESVGAKFVELPLETGDAEDKGGYATQQDEEFYRRQREFMSELAAESDVIVTTAAIPGKKSPLLLTEAAVQGMADGSVIVDLAAERGGNCESSEADEKVVKHGVTILGPTNLPAEVPNHASQMLSNNVTKFVTHLVKDGNIELDMEDEITHDTLTTRDGEVTHARVRDILGLEPMFADIDGDELDDNTDAAVSEPVIQDETNEAGDSSGTRFESPAAVAPAAEPEVSASDPEVSPPEVAGPLAADNSSDSSDDDPFGDIQPAEPSSEDAATSSQDDARAILGGNEGAGDDAGKASLNVGSLTDEETEPAASESKSESESDSPATPDSKDSSTNEGDK